MSEPTTTHIHRRAHRSMIDDDDDDARSREDECEALVAIYGEERCVTYDANDGTGCKVVELAIGDGWKLEVRAPRGYPSREAPRADVVARDRTTSEARAVESRAGRRIREVWAAKEGEACIFDWAEETRELVEETERALRGDDDSEEEGVDVDTSDIGALDLADVEAELQAIANAAVARSAASACDTTDARRADVRARLSSHELVVEKKSIFQAHVCRDVKSVEEIDVIMDILYESRKVRDATHNILAYRIERADKSESIHQDHDDDGETAAGGRLLRLLQLADARNVAVVVSRWYGGVKLGPSRFHVINETAKKALEALGEIHQ